MNSALRTMSDEDLDSAILSTTIALDSAKTKLSLLLFELQSRVKDDVMRDYAAAGKDSGTVTFEYCTFTSSPAAKRCCAPTIQWGQSHRHSHL